MIIVLKCVLVHLTNIHRTQSNSLDEICEKMTAVGAAYVLCTLMCQPEEDGTYASPL